MSIQVVNKYKCSDHIYIGRGSPLGNPFVMRSEADRAKVIEQYKQYFENQLKIVDSPVRVEMIRLYNLAKAGHDIKLGCFCAPKACHGDVIKEKLESVL